MARPDLLPSVLLWERAAQISRDPRYLQQRRHLRVGIVAASVDRESLPDRRKASHDRAFPDRE